MDPETRTPDPVPEIVSLAREIEPDPSLEHRTVQRLRDGRLLREPASRLIAWRVAAALLLFLGGVVAGRATTASPVAPAAPGEPRFMLLLHGEVTGRDQTDEAALVNEYRDWAVKLRSDGRFVSGERLGDEIAIVPDVTLPDVGGLKGYFLVSAPTLDDALAVARSCPHARRGGHVIVRPINPT